MNTMQIDMHAPIRESWPHPFPIGRPEVPAPVDANKHFHHLGPQMHMHEDGLREQMAWLTGPTGAMQEVVSTTSSYFDEAGGVGSYGAEQELPY